MMGTCKESAVGAYKKQKSSIQAYQDLDNVDARVALCRDPTHSSQKLTIEQDGRTVCGCGGYRQVKASHGVSEGRWYYEVEIKYMKNQGNARIGWSTIAGDLQAPCGYDQWSYSYRGQPGSLFHDSQRVAMPSVDHELGFKSGDVLGVMIYLPQPSDQHTELLDKRRWKAPGEYKQIDIRLPMEHMGDASEIRYFRNGKALSQKQAAFSNLILGKYYPAISLFRQVCVHVNFGPSFAYPPPGLCTLDMPSNLDTDAVQVDVYAKANALYRMHQENKCYAFAHVRYVAPCVSLDTHGSYVQATDNGPISPRSLKTAAPKMEKV